MVPVVRKMILKDKMRFLITIMGTGITIMLMLFLFNIYEGVQKGAISYISNSPANIWICQKNCNNLLRSSSFVDTSVGIRLKGIEGINKVSSILRFMTTASINGKNISLVVYGIDTSSDLAIPTTIAEGSASLKHREIILDMAFATKYKLSVADSILLNNYYYKVTGISDETNAIVAQFAFINIEDASDLLGIRNVVSFYLIQKETNQDTYYLVDSVKRSFPNLEVYSREEFIQNNLEELGKGLLPVLWTIAVFSIIVGISVITLMMYSSVLEKKEDYALLKALGASHFYLMKLVIRQSITGSVTGFILGLVFDLVSEPLIKVIVPEIALSFSFYAVISVFLISIFIGVSGSLVPVNRLSRIYPAEVFRA